MISAEGESLLFKHPYRWAADYPDEIFSGREEGNLNYIVKQADYKSNNIN